MKTIIKSISYSLCGSLTSNLTLTLLNKNKANLFFSSIACLEAAASLSLWPPVSTIPCLAELLVDKFCLFTRSSLSTTISRPSLDKSSDRTNLFMVLS